MSFKKIGGDEVLAAGMAHRGPELHLLSHARVDGFRLHGAAGIELAPIPFRNAARRDVDTTTETALIWSWFLFIGIVSVAFHLLDSMRVNRLHVLIYQLLPTRL